MRSCEPKVISVANEGVLRALAGLTDLKGIAGRSEKRG